MLSERYALDEVIATGGMATVYRARDEVLARTVAVKILDPRLADDQSFLERFRREALAAARLTHPNIVSIYDTGTEEKDDGARHFIVMEFCGGGTLADLLAAEAPLQPDRLAAIGAAICDALAYAHRNEVIHRDVKPANVLLADDGAVKVSDFGIAKAAFTGKDVTTSGALLGTVTYISPEQAQGEEPDERSDIYSLGVVLYELATGRPPFSADSPLATAMLHVKEPPPPPRTIRGGIPRDLEEVILSALAKDPAERPATADELRARLTKRAASGATAVIPHARAPSPTARPREDASWVVRVVLLIIAVVGIALAATWLLSAEESPFQDDRSGGGREQGTTLDVVEVRDFDPEGGDGEHPLQVDLTIDGNDTTAWETETYDDGFAGVDKSGVGLLFDLGESVEISTVELVTDTPGMIVELRSSDEPGTTETSFELVDGTESATETTTFEVDSSGQYWLVWITELPTGSGVAAISEVRFFGP